jgi:hypothetical protein
MLYLSFSSSAVVRADVVAVSNQQLRGFAAGDAVDASADPAQGAMTVTGLDALESLFFETSVRSLQAKRALQSNDTIVCRVTVDVQGFVNGSDVETVMCIPIRDGIETDWIVPIPMPQAVGLLEMHSQLVVEQGVFVVSISGVVALKRGRMVLTPESTVQVLPPEEAAVQYDNPQVRRRIMWSEHDQEHRQLAVTGTRTIAIIRVNAVGTSNAVTKAQLMSAWFGAQATSYKNQMSLCSNSALQIAQGPYYDIKLTQNIASFKTFEAMQLAIEKKLSAVAKKPLNTIASHLVYCYPAKSPGGVWYGKGTCLPVLVLMLSMPIKGLHTMVASL